MVRTAHAASSFSPPLSLSPRQYCPLRHANAPYGFGISPNFRILVHGPSRRSPRPRRVSPSSLWSLDVPARLRHLWCTDGLSCSYWLDFPSRVPPHPPSAAPPPASCSTTHTILILIYASWSMHPRPFKSYAWIYFSLLDIRMHAGRALRMSCMSSLCSVRA